MLNMTNEREDEANFKSTPSNQELESADTSPGENEEFTARFLKHKKTKQRLLIWS